MYKLHEIEFSRTEFSLIHITKTRPKNKNPSLEKGIWPVTFLARTEKTLEQLR